MDTDEQCIACRTAATTRVDIIVPNGETWHALPACKDCREQLEQDDATYPRGRGFVNTPLRTLAVQGLLVRLGRLFGSPRTYPALTASRMRGDASSADTASATGQASSS